MKAFKVTGHFQMGHNKQQPFTKEFAAADANAARERTLSDLGSRHGVHRRQIQIADVVEMKPDDVTNDHVRHTLALGA